MAGHPFQDKDYKIIILYKMSKEGIKIGYVTVLVRLTFVSILSCTDCANLTLEAIILLHFFFRYLLKISNATMLIK